MLITINQHQHINTDAIDAVVSFGASVSIYLRGGNIVTAYGENGDGNALADQIRDLINAGEKE